MFLIAWVGLESHSCHILNSVTFKWCPSSEENMFRAFQFYLSLKTEPDNKKPSISSQERPWRRTWGLRCVLLGGKWMELDLCAVWTWRYTVLAPVCLNWVYMIEDQLLNLRLLMRKFLQNVKALFWYRMICIPRMHELFTRKYLFRHWDVHQSFLYFGKWEPCQLLPLRPDKSLYLHIPSQLSGDPAEVGIWFPSYSTFGFMCLWFILL